MYEIEFIVISGNAVKEYDYEIAVSDGSIVSYDYDVESSYTVPGGNQATGTITEAEAKALVLAQIPGASEIHIVKWKLDRDDGRWIYEGEVVYNSWEYEFEVDAVSGRIIEWDIDSVFD